MVSVRALFGGSGRLFPFAGGAVASGLVALCVLVAALAGVLAVPAAGASDAQIGLTESRGQFSEAEGAGRLSLQYGSAGHGLAVNNDSSSLFDGDVYVGDTNNNRIDRFSATGTFQLAWGWGVATGANELQVCTTSCRRGEENVGSTGAITDPFSLAVDSDPLSSSAGDVYVVDGGYNRVEKFGPSGEFLLMFGGGVNEMTGGDVCDAGEHCKKGTAGSGNGQFELGFGDAGDDIAVGPNGRVYVGDGTPRVQVFEPSGVWVETISLSKLSATGGVKALAVSSAGDVFVKDGGATGVRELEPGGVEKGTQFDAGSSTVTSIAVSGAGEVFVGDRGEDTNFGFHVLKYLPTGKLVDSYGAKTVRGGIFKQEEPGHPAHPEIAEYFNAMAFSESADSVYASEAFTEELNKENSKIVGVEHLDYSSVWALPVPPPGPVISAESATPGAHATAVFEGTVNPEGNETTYHFEYVTEAQFDASGYSAASSTPSAKLAASVEEKQVSAEVGGLSPATVYRYRLVASNGEGTARGQEGAEGTFEIPPAALIESEYVSDVASSSATLGAAVNPLGSSTEYRFEYGTSTAYGGVASGSLGDGTSPVSIAAHIQGLEAGATYHYRVVTENALGSAAGPDRTFTTQAAGGGLSLPDGREWELVSPANKQGSLIEPFSASGALTEAAADGDAITYLSLEALGEDVESKNGLLPSQVLSTRGPTGWRTQNIALPRELAGEGERVFRMLSGFHEYDQFSPDLGTALVEPWGEVPPLSSEANERTAYLRDDANGLYEPLVAPRDVSPPGTSYGGSPQEATFEMHAVGATPDLSHVVLESPIAVPLTEETARPPSCPASGFNEFEGVCGSQTQSWNLYEWSGGRLKLVDVLPNGEPMQPSYGKGDGGSAFLGVESRMTAHAISNDGRWIAWQTGEWFGGKARHLYVRDMVGEKTYQIGGSQPIFQTMSSDGSKVFFLEDGELHVFDTATGAETDLTADHAGGEANAGVQEAILGAGEAGSYLYFVAKGVLAGASGAESGAYNLYVMHEAGGVWMTERIATLSPEDAPDWYPARGDSESCNEDQCATRLQRVASEVSPDGRYLEFMSDRSLTGYDNTDAVSGEPDEEVYLYDAVSKRLVCASCDPTGARPVGVLDTAVGAEGPVFDKAGSWSGRWVAATVPGWQGPNAYGSYLSPTYHPRFLSDSGRLFFNSTDALVPQDTDGTVDVYEYEPAGVGSCTTASTTFGESSHGCVGLISSGTSATDSAFLDASENGDDVFFITTSQLVAGDRETSYSVYDAHVCGAEGVACTVEPVSPPPCTTGDSCKAAPTPQPELYGATPSATFSGAGNVVQTATPTAKGKAKKPRSKKQSKPKAKDRGHRKRGKATGKGAGRKRAAEVRPRAGVVRGRGSR